MKKKLLSIATALILITSQANASGIPTIDVAAIAQSVMHYVQVLKDYSEQIKQYEQMVTDTMNFEKQMKELGVDMNSVNEIFGEINGMVNSMKSIYSEVSSIPDNIMGSISRMKNACNFLEQNSSFFGVEINKINRNNIKEKTNRCIVALSNGLEIDRQINEIYKQIEKTTDYAQMRALRSQVDNLQKAREAVKQEQAKEQFVKMMGFHDLYTKSNDKRYSKAQMDKDLKDFASQLNRANNQKQAQALTNALLLKMLEQSHKQYELTIEYTKASMLMGSGNGNGILDSHQVSEDDYNQKYKETSIDENLIDLGYRNKQFTTDELGLPIIGVQR